MTDETIDNKADAEHRARWTTSWHEAGHLKAHSIFFGVTGVAVITPGGGGLTFPTGRIMGCEGLMADCRSESAAIYAACGPAAERLAKRWPWPTGAKVASNVEAALGRPGAVSDDDLERKIRRTKMVEDAEFIAQYCIAGRPRRPTEWRRRYRRVNRKAHEFVKKYTEELMRLAVVLYLHGVGQVTGSATTDVGTDRQKEQS